MGAKKPKTIRAYMCGVDWQHKLRHAADGNMLYPSLKDLKRHREYWDSCGVVSVRVTLGRWVVKQDLNKGAISVAEFERARKRLLKSLAKPKAQRRKGKS